MKVKGIPKLNGFSYDVQATRYLSDGLTKLTEKGITYQIIDKIIFPAPLLPQRPCKFTSEQTYKIVRQYVKQHINLEVAEITSDYDFCFTVKKKIPLSETEKFTVDVNAWSGLFGRKKKSKYETRCRRERLVECFEMTHSGSGYKGYTPIKEFIGENHEDLKNKIDTYCKNLIDFINIPLQDCKHCKGLGVIPQSKNKEAQ